MYYISIYIFDIDLLSLLFIPIRKYLSTVIMLGNNIANFIQEPYKSNTKSNRYEILNKLSKGNINHTL